MAALYLTFLAVALATLTGREAVRVARMAAAGAQTGALLAVVLVSAGLACAAVAWVAGTFGGLLDDEQKVWFVAAALALAALEVLFLDPPKPAEEPTQSLGAIALVVFAGVLADAGGLLVLSLALYSGDPALAAAGGALAAATILSVAGIAAADWEKLPRRQLRPAAAAILAISGIVIALSAQ